VRTLLLCLIAASALVNWWSRLPGERRGSAIAELVSKPLTTVLVIALALTSDAPSNQVTAAVIALCLCLVGDLALMVPIDQFVVGLGAFLVAHLTFITLLARYGLGHTSLAGMAVIAGAVLGAIVGRAILFAVRASQPALVWPVGIYLIVILAMAAFGWATGRAAVLVGVTAFVVSDSILGWEVFVRRNRWQPLAIMVTYHVAITSLALSL